MYLRALGSLLARSRRFPARGIPRAQAESSAGIGINKAPGSSTARPARSLHTLRDLAFGDGSYSYAPGAAAAGALAGFVALLYFNKDTDKSAAEATGVESRKEVPLHILQGLQEEEALKVKFMDKEGKMNWLEYLDYIDNRRYRGGKHYDTEVIGKVVISSEDDVEVEELKVDEEAMQARFEAFMKEFDRSYKSEEEKAYRYEIFKKRVIEAERLNKRNASKSNGACFGTTQFSDWTEEEWNSWMGCTDPFPWEEYLSLRKSIIVEGRDRRGMTSKAKNTQDVSSIKN